MLRRCCLTSVTGAMLAAACVELIVARVGVAQETAPPNEQPPDGIEIAAEPAKLLDRQPFDRITLNADNANAVLETVLLDLPERTVPNPLPAAGDLELRLLNQPTAPYTVAWNAIAKVELYEQMLLAEAERLTASSQFAEAFDDLAFLRLNYPNLPGLEPALQEHLWRDASTAFAARDGEGAWPALVALYARNPEYPRLTSAVQAVSDHLIGRRLAEKNYAAARAVLDAVVRDFPDLELANIASWRERFESDARAQLAKARAAIAAGDFDGAREAAMFAYAILPDFAVARELVREIQQSAPEVRVGVTQMSAPASMSQTPSWAAARGVELFDPRLVEMVAFGNEGGEYACRFGEVRTSDSGLETTLRLSPEGLRRGVTPEAIALRIVDVASYDRDECQEDLASLLKGASVVDGREVRLQWNRSHLHPEALLAAPLRQVTSATRGPGLWLEPLPPREGVEEIRYQRTGPAEAAAGAPRFVIEQAYDDDEAALAALLRGEVDAVDRVPPWQLAQMRATPEVVVAQYQLPTVHVLVPNPDSELLALREFRRALCYGIDREGIVRDILLGGGSQPGFRPLSGPFPAGTSINDPVGYAYDPDLPMRPYEPRLAALLANVARTTLAKRRADEQRAVAAQEESTDDGAQDGEGVDETAAIVAEDEPPLDPLVLAHPADSLARVSCQAIKLQLDSVGIPVKLVELPALEPKAAVEYDLLYAELAVREPLVDARRLLAGDGVARRASAAMMAALDRLDRAQNWNEARTRLREIHRLAYYDLPVVPLWQTVNWLAVRTWLEGVGQQPVTLYQNLDAWRKEFAE